MNPNDTRAQKAHDTTALPVSNPDRTDTATTGMTDDGSGVFIIHAPSEDESPYHAWLATEGAPESLEDWR